MEMAGMLLVRPIFKKINLTLLPLKTKKPILSYA